MNPVKSRSLRFAVPLAVLALSLASLAQQTAQQPHRRTRLKKPASQEQKQAPRAEIIRENNYGVALMNRQHFEEALGKFQRACILDQDTDVACVNVGIAFLNMQRFDDAKQILRKS